MSHRKGLTISGYVYSAQINTFIMKEWIHNTVPFKYILLPLALRKKDEHFKKVGLQLLSSNKHSPLDIMDG